ncbi:hypothetical protein SAMN05216360_109216 [Methylobacterium phyllostachyos]|uniref:Uncharacterized protein n=1 Tax=Methylobacterium phyllostachyos TaxID=582672 RepID=A0A1H0CMK8_9HYPH|nr:hypothetical protein [Methylobacterium phyllostachyos]SDN59085.1 hypothetical protein SAMN05216360_109216 [Methylobacterium phyllostachyos]
MTVETRLLTRDALPPIRIQEFTTKRISKDNPMSRLGRIVCVLAALALPVFGIAVADTVHRAGETKASQAAAPVNPSDGAAAPQRAITPLRALRAARVASRAIGRGEVRS